MAQGETSTQEKTEHATPKRLREARKKGQVPKSRDIGQVFVLILVFLIFAMFLPWMGGILKAYFELCFKSLAENEMTGATIYELGKAGLFTMIKILAPLLLTGTLVAFLTGIVQTGALFSGEPLKPKPERLNPIEGLKNMFKAVVLIELAKNILKVAAVFYIAYSTLNKAIGDVLLSSRIDLLSSAQLTGGLIFEFIIKVGICFILISLFDYAVQRWNFMKNMRMSKEEVKREYKQDEGDPAIKGERRRLHREMAFGDVKRAVKQADVVVTNPIHVACALEYKKEEMSSPQLVVKGQQAFAEMIVQLAREEGVPIIRNIPLAWSLLKLEEGDEIPEDLYGTVAEVLAMVYEMKQAKEHPSPPSGKPQPTVYV